MSGERQELRNIVEAALFVAESPLSVKRIQSLFPEDAEPSRDEVLAVLHDLLEESAGRGVELREIDGGWRFQTRDRYSPWLNRLFEKRPPRYSRALLETLAIIAYRQPVTRGDVEEIRGVAVSSDIMRTLQDRDWVKTVGQRDVPGRPSLYATTRGFLEYFNLRSLADLPDLSEQRDIDEIAREMNLTLPFPGLDGEGEAADGDTASAAANDAADADAGVDAAADAAVEAGVDGGGQAADEVETVDADRAETPESAQTAVDGVGEGEGDSSGDGASDEEASEGLPPEAGTDTDAARTSAGSAMAEEVAGVDAEAGDLDASAAEPGQSPEDPHPLEETDEDPDADRDDRADVAAAVDSRPALRVVAGTAVAGGEGSEDAAGGAGTGGGTGPAADAEEAPDGEAGVAGRPEPHGWTPGDQDDEPESGPAQDRGEDDAARTAAGRPGGGGTTDSGAADAAGSAEAGEPEGAGGSDPSGRGRPGEAESGVEPPGPEEADGEGRR